MQKEKKTKATTNAESVKKTTKPVAAKSSTKVAPPKKPTTKVVAATTVKQKAKADVKTAVKSKSSPMPKTLLNKWLKGRKEWDHQDWLGLLDTLTAQGHDVWATEKAHEIGAYLESHRESSL